jgi:hypothetical protein
MATRFKRVINTEDINQNEDDMTENQTFTQNAQDDYLPEDIALANVLADLGSASGAAVRIYRQGPGGYRDLTLLTECMPEEFSPMTLQNEFGGGTFRIHVRANGQLLANQELKVAAPQVTRHQPDMLSPIQGQINALAETMRQMADAMRTPPPPQQSRADMIQEMMMMKELFGTAPAARAADPLDQLDKIMGVHARLSELTGNAPAQKPDNMAALWDAAKTFLPMIAAAAQQRPPAPMQNHQAAPMAPMPVQANLPHAAEETPPPHDEGAEMFKMYLAMLIEKAKGNSDPTGYAHIIIDSITDDQINQLLAPENWLEILAAVNPNVMQCREWFTELREIVFELLREQAGDDTSAGNPQVITPEPGHAISSTPNTNTPGAS